MLSPSYYVIVPALPQINLYITLKPLKLPLKHAICFTKTMILVSQGMSYEKSFSVEAILPLVTEAISL